MPVVGVKCRPPPPWLYSDPIGLFTTICLSAGIGTAIGLVAGTTGLEGSARGRMTLLAAVLGLLAGYLIVIGEAGPGLAGALFTALFAALACAVFCDVKLGASRRVEATSPGGGTGALGALMVAGAIVLAALTLLFEPIGLVAAVGVAWLAIARRRKADRKHAGLRSLR